MDKERKINELTFGYEWETLLLDKYGISPKTENIANLVSRMRKELKKTRTGFDWIPRMERSLYEIRSGIMKNGEELRKITEEIVKMTLIYGEEEGLRFLPVGSYFPLGSAIGLHIHTGSWEFIDGLQEMVNCVYPYVPVLAALSVNSPIWGIEQLNPPIKYKSFRIKYHAQMMSIPYYVPSRMHHIMWETDLVLKFFRHPTIELRICDAPLSWNFVCEVTALTVSFLNEFFRNPEPMDENRYIEAIDNRMRAMKDGLQAIFLWRKKERSVTEILKEMINIAKPTLSEIGYKELKIIEKMIEKKQTQADFIFSLFDNYNSDIYGFTNYMASAFDWLDDPFKLYLEYAPPLKSSDLMDINDYLLSNIGERTTYSSLYKVLFQTAEEFEKRIHNLIDKGLIKHGFDNEEGSNFTRT